MKFKQRPVILFDATARHAEQDCACADIESFPVFLYKQQHTGAETDCACADAHCFLPSTQTLPDKILWQRAPHLYRAPLTDTHELVFNPFGSAGVVVLNQPACVMLDEFTQPKPLTDSTARQLAELELLQRYNMPLKKPVRRDQTLTAWLHLTNQCNLRCTYCYLTKTDEAMDEATGLKAVETVFRTAKRYDFQVVKLKYAGGEPTLQFPLLQKLHRHAQHLSVKSNLHLREVILSNGVSLTSSMLDFIREAGMRLMISLDGIGASHDAQRIFPGGYGSFSAVVKSIDRALRRGVKPHLSITITRYNAPVVVEAVAFALERELFFNLNFYRQHTEKNAGNLCPVEEKTLIDGLQVALTIIEEKLPAYSLIAGLLDRTSFAGPHIYPCGAGRNYLVIDHRGQIARCQMEMNHIVTNIFADDPLAAIRSNQVGFQNVAVNQKIDCRHCLWRYWCAGGCPLLVHRLGRGSQRKSPYCNVYRTLYPQMLRLEGLRLLKWHTPPN